MIDELRQNHPANSTIRFSVIGDAWRYFWAQPGAWLGATAIYIGLFVLSFVLQSAIPGFEEDERWFMRFDAPLPLFAAYLSGIVISFTSAGLLRMALRQIDGHTISVADFFSIRDVAGPLALASVIISLPMTIAGEFYFLPACIVDAIFLFTLPAIVDKRLEAIPAMRLSWNTLKRHIVMATIFSFTLMVIFASGIFMCVVGILLTNSLHSLAIGRLYRDFFPVPGLQPQPAPSSGGFYPPIPEVPQ